MRIAAGIIDIIAGFVSIRVFMIWMKIYWHEYVEYHLLPQLMDYDTILLTLTLLIAIIMIMVGIMVFSRRSWPLAFTTSILFFLLTVLWWFNWAEARYLFPFMFAGWFLGLSTILFTVISKKQFVGPSKA